MLKPGTVVWSICPCKNYKNVTCCGHSKSWLKHLVYISGVSSS